MSRMKALFDLQILDTRLAQISARLARVDGLLSDDAAVAAARDELRQATALQTDTSKALRVVQSEREALKEHIAREEQRLYSGQVKAAKELQGLQLEVDSLKRRLAGLDDRALEAMLASDAANERMATAEAAAAEAEAAAAVNHRALSEERQRLESARQRLTTARRAATQEIPTADLARYDRLLQQHRGRALAALEGDSCGACGVRVARHIVELVVSDSDPVGCGHCGRLLYAGIAAQ